MDSRLIEKGIKIGVAEPATALTKSGAYIAHNAMWPPTVFLQIWVCYARSSLQPLVSRRHEEWATEDW